MKVWVEGLASGRPLVQLDINTAEIGFPIQFERLRSLITEEIQRRYSITVPDESIPQFNIWRREKPDVEVINKQNPYIAKTNDKTIISFRIHDRDIMLQLINKIRTEMACLKESADRNAAQNALKQANKKGNAEALVAHQALPTASAVASAAAAVPTVVPPTDKAQLLRLHAAIDNDAELALRIIDNERVPLDGIRDGWGRIVVDAPLWHVIRNKNYKTSDAERAEIVRRLIKKGAKLHLRKERGTGNGCAELLKPGELKPLNEAKSALLSEVFIQIAHPNEIISIHYTNLKIFLGHSNADFPKEIFKLISQYIGGGPGPNQELTAHLAQKQWGIAKGELIVGFYDKELACLKQMSRAAFACSVGIPAEIAMRLVSDETRESFGIKAEARIPESVFEQLTSATAIQPSQFNLNSAAKVDAEINLETDLKAAASKAIGAWEKRAVQGTAGSAGAMLAPLPIVTSNLYQYSQYAAKYAGGSSSVFAPSNRDASNSSSLIEKIHPSGWQA